MILVPPGVRILLATQPCDFRRGMDSLAALVQQALAPVGIRVNLKVEPTNLYYNHWTEVSFGLTDWTSRPVAAQILAQSFRSTAEWNAAHWKNPQFDEMLAKFPQIRERRGVECRQAVIVDLRHVNSIPRAV